MGGEQHIAQHSSLGQQRGVLLVLASPPQPYYLSGSQAGRRGCSSPESPARRDPGSYSSSCKVSAVRAQHTAPPSPPPPPSAPRPRSPLAHGCDHGKVQPVVHDAIPVTDHDAVCCAQVRLTLSRQQMSQGGGEHLPHPQTPPVSRVLLLATPMIAMGLYLSYVDLCKTRNEAILLQ